jgi:ppGpp synthetase/RelA/SpoT-type nucleotidyltranferase
VNLYEYENKYLSTYIAFAETVRFILDKALLAAENLPRPQSFQCRAKGIESLRQRLTEAGKLDTQTLEIDRRDLSGVRLIFYTNNDVDRFLASRLILENFEIEEDSTKVHHPTPENKGIKYRAIHYTVLLCKDRIRLPEYAKFDGLRCEIQVQTILNHAWSETSHDPIYKAKMGNGYGKKAMDAITRRFESIMDKYLIPAGYEIQRAQQEYERLLQGKELFDRDIANLLDNAKNNNERYEILSGLKDYAIPNYDDLPMAYEGLKDSLRMAVKAARQTEPVPIKTIYGDTQGFKTDAVTRLVLEIIENLRYADVLGTLQLLIDVFRDESDDDIRRQIVNVAKKLSEYNIDIYKQVGPTIQMTLVDKLAEMSDVELDSIRPIALTIWTEAIESGISGEKWKADSVIVSTGALPVSNELLEVRDKAIKALFTAYDRSTDDAQKSSILSALDAATRMPHQTQYSDQLLATTLKDTTRIVNFLTQRAMATSYELLQHLEHQFLYEYFRAKGFTEDLENQFGCQDEAKALVTEIIKFRDTINIENRFVKYKVLVGFESVYPGHWIDQAFQYEESEKYRLEVANRYIDEINATNENDWFDLIMRCAETKTTYDFFGNFISKLTEYKPEVADRFLSKALDDLRRFLVYFLNGMASSGRCDLYDRNLENELVLATNLVGIARHLRYSDVQKPDFAARLLKRAIEKVDSIAVNECLLLALEHYGTERIADVDAFLRDAFTYLNDHKETRWVFNAWFLQKATKFYDELTPEVTKQFLQNLGYLSKVDFRVEPILVRLAERQPEVIWDYFGARLTRDSDTRDSEEESRFEAIPFRFHVLEKELSKDPQLAISKGLSWFVQDPKLFRFRGGRLLSITFPSCTMKFAATLAEFVKTGKATEADFALAILQNYNGEPSTYSVLKEIVFQFPDDALKMNEVKISIDNTGVVRGELGFAESWRANKESLTEWLTDERPAVKAFAEKHIVELDLKIASEQRSAEAKIEMRIRSYDEESNELDHDDIN